MNRNRKLSTRAILFLAGQCIRQYSAEKKINLDCLFKFCAHLEGYSSANDLPDWDDVSYQLEITGFGDPLPSYISGNLREEIDYITSTAREISASQMYTVWNYEKAHKGLVELAELCNFRLSDLEKYYLHSPGEYGWGKVVSLEIYEQWQS